VKTVSCPGGHLQAYVVVKVGLRSQLAEAVYLASSPARTNKELPGGCRIELHLHAYSASQFHPLLLIWVMPT
jgi:hypothetical protein